MAPFMSEDEFNQLDTGDQQPGGLTVKQAQPIRQGRIPMLHYFAGKYQQGVRQVDKGLAGWDAATHGGEKYEQYKQEFSVDLDPGVTGRDSVLPWHDLERMLGETAQAIPYMTTNIADRVAGAGTGAVAGVIASLGNSGGVLAAPELLVGAQTGQTLAGWMSSARIESGNLYMDMREAGLKHDTAVKFAMAGGGVSGFLESFGVNRLGGIAKKAFFDQLKTGTGQNLMKSWYAQFAKEAGVQIAEEELQEISSIVATNLAALYENNPNAEVSAEQIRERLVTTAQLSLGPSVILPAASQAVGATAGAIKSGKLQTTAESITDSVGQAADAARGAEFFKTVATKITSGKLKLSEAMEVITRVIQEEKQDQDSAQAKEAATPDSVEAAFDTLTTPLFDEEGRVNQPSSDKVLEARVEVTEQVSETLAGALEGAELQQRPLVAPDVEARQKRVSSEIRTIDKQITGLEKRAEKAQQRFEKDIQKQIDAANKTLEQRRAEGKPTKAVENQIAKLQVKLASVSAESTKLLAQADKLTSLRDDLALENQLIDEGLLSTEDLSKAKADITVGKLAKIKAKSAENAIKAFEQGIRKGSKITKDTISNVQREVSNVIRQSDLEAKDKAKFLSAIRTINTPEKLQKQLPTIRKRIATLAEQAYVRSEKQRSQKLLKRGNLVKGGKKPKGKFDAQTQQALDTYKTFIGNKAARDAEVSKVMGIVSSPDNSGKSLYELFEGDQLIQAQVALETQGYEQKTGRELELLNDAIDKLIKTGRMEALERQEQRKLQRDERRKQAIESVIGDKPRHTFTRKTNLQKLKQSLDAAIAGQESWGGLMRLLSEFDPEHKLEELMDVHEAKRQESKNTLATEEYMVFRLQDAMFPNDNKRSRHRNLFNALQDKARPMEISYIDADGRQVVDRLSKLDLWDIWMKMQDTTLREALSEGNRYTFKGEVQGVSTEEMIENNMGPEDIAGAQALLSFYEEYFERLDSFYRERNGVGLKRVDNYSPVKRKSIDKEEQWSPLDEWQDRMSITPGSAIGRVNSVKPIAVNNALDQAVKHIMQWEHYVNWSEAIDRINDVLGHGEFQDLVADRYGNGTLEIVRKHYKDFIADRIQMYNASYNMLDSLRINMAKAKLGAKTVYQAAVQMTSIFSFYDYIPSRDITPAYIDLFSGNPITKILEMWELSPILQARWYNLNRDVKDIVNSSEFKILSKRKDLDSLLLAGLRFGDRLNIALGGYAVYHSVLKRTGDKQAAVRAVERAAEETQQSGSIDQLSSIQRDNGLTRLFSTMFISQPNQLMRKEWRAVRDFINGPKSLESTKEFAKKMAIYHIAQPVAYQMVARGFSFDDEDWDKYARAAVLGNINGIFVLGEMLEYAARVAWDAVLDSKERTFAPGSVLYDEADDVLGLFKELLKLGQQDNIETFDNLVEDSDKEENKLLEKTIAATDVALGLPTETMYRMAQSFQDSVAAKDPVAIMLSMGGWPRSAIKRRLKKTNPDEVESFDQLDAEAQGLVEEDLNPMAQFIRDLFSNMDYQINNNNQPTEQPEEVPEVEAITLEESQPATSDGIVSNESQEPVSEEAEALVQELPTRPQR